VIEVDYEKIIWVEPYWASSNKKICCMNRPLIVTLKGKNVENRTIKRNSWKMH
jgi:hypothetical protein